METTSKISQSLEKENNITQDLAPIRHKTVIDYFTNSNVVEQYDLLACNDSQNISTQVDKGEIGKNKSNIIQVIPNCQKPTDFAEQTPPQISQANVEITPVQLIEDLLEDKKGGVTVDDCEKMAVETSNLPVLVANVIAEETVSTEIVNEHFQPTALATEQNIVLEEPTTTNQIPQQTEGNLEVKAVVELIGGKSISDNFKTDEPTKVKSIKKSISKLKRKVLKRRNNLYRNIKSKINTYIRGSKKYSSSVKTVSKKSKAKMNKPAFIPFKRTSNSTILGASAYQNTWKSDIKRKRKPAVPKFRNIKKPIKRFK